MQTTRSGCDTTTLCWYFTADTNTNTIITATATTAATDND